MKKKDIYKYFLKVYKSEGFSKYLSSLEKERIKDSKIEEQYLKLGHPSIFETKLFDVVENNELNKLIKSICKLSSKNYKTKCPLASKVMIGIKFDMASYGELAEIEFLNDKYFRKIEILYSTLDSWRVFLEIRFFYKNDLNSIYDKLIDDCLLQNIRDDKNIKCRIDKLDENNFHWVYSFYKECIYIILNRFLHNLHYKNNTDFLSMDVLSFENDYDFENFAPDYMDRIYINTKNNFLIRHCPFEEHLYLYVSNNTKTDIHISKMIMDYGLSFYYYFFGELEINGFKVQLNPVVADVKPIRASLLKKLFKRVCALQNQEINDKRFYLSFENDGWICKDSSISGSLKIAELPIHDFKKFFNDYYSYCKSILEIRNASISKWLAIIAIIVSFVSFVASIVLSFCKNG